MAVNRGSGDGPPTVTKCFSSQCRSKLALAIVMLQLIGPVWWWPITVVVIIANPFPGARTAMLAYLVYIFWYDRDAHKRTTGRTPIRRMAFWKAVADYFPVRLHKYGHLDPRERYILCGHPHGIGCFSFLANFFIEATGFSQNFPGIKLFPVLLDSHFFTPVHREVALCAGFRGNTRDAMTTMLTNGPPGTSLFLIPGGAPEALLSLPGEYNLILNSRKGFVRIALITGAHLVPILAFGETSLFEVKRPVPGSLWEKVQKFVLKTSGFGIPTISGAGFWSGSGPLPKALPLDTVVGAPVLVTKWVGSTDSKNPEFRAAVDEAHARYVKAVRALWDEHSKRFEPSPGAWCFAFVE